MGWGVKDVHNPEGGTKIARLGESQKWELGESTEL